jgi:hypothetical protein
MGKTLNSQRRGRRLRLHLAGRDHKEIKNRRQLPQVEHDEVSASRFGCDASGGDRTFEPCVSGRIRVRAMVWARHAVLVGQGDDRR